MSKGRQAEDPVVSSARGKLVKALRRIALLDSQLAVAQAQANDARVKLNKVLGNEDRTQGAFAPLMR